MSRFMQTWVQIQVHKFVIYDKSEVVNGEKIQATIVQLSWG